MRLISWNILDGGEGRADPLAEVIEAQRPDVVALVEADMPAVVKRIARRMKMDFIIGNGRGHSAALLSRWPIQQSINHAALDPRLRRSFLEATVQDPSGVEWPIYVVHLSAGATDADEETRMGELSAVLDRGKPHCQAGRPHLICGDFNSNAPYQQIDPMKCKLKTRQAWESNGSQLPRRVIGSMISAGYLDTFAALHDEQKKLLGSFTTQHPGQRVDYIFSFGVPTVGVKAAWVEQDRLAKYASDHFPLGVEIDGTP